MVRTKLNATPWEQRLIERAQVLPERDAANQGFRVNIKRLNLAYALCEAITAEHSRTFYLASSLLPRNQKQAIRALYAFCRLSDDLVDRATGDRQAKFDQWRQRILDNKPADDDLVALAWADARTKYKIPTTYVHQFLDGVATDLTTGRYGTFADLAEYCYGVAATVGLMSMHIIGFSKQEAIPYAVKLGVALQMTNILRDVGEDWTNGRLYLPQEELIAFDLTEGDIAAGQVDQRWQAFMRFQIGRTRQLYAEALPGIALLHWHGRLAIAAAAELYRAILEDIERHEHDVFNHRAYLSSQDKLVRLPGILWRVTTQRHQEEIEPQSSGLPINYQSDKQGKAPNN